MLVGDAVSRMRWESYVLWPLPPVCDARGERTAGAGSGESGRMGSARAILLTSRNTPSRHAWWLLAVVPRADVRPFWVRFSTLARPTPASRLSRCTRATPPALCALGAACGSLPMSPCGPAARVISGGARLSDERRSEKTV